MIKGIKQIIDETIDFHTKMQQLERDALNKIHINLSNVYEITEAVMFFNHEDKMKVFNKLIEISPTRIFNNHL